MGKNVAATDNGHGGRKQDPCCAAAQNFGSPAIQQAEKAWHGVMRKKYSGNIIPCRKYLSCHPAILKLSRPSIPGPLSPLEKGGGFYAS
jgi:hypothetical protein